MAFGLPGGRRFWLVLLLVVLLTLDACDGHKKQRRRRRQRKNKRTSSDSHSDTSSHSSSHSSSSSDSSSSSSSSGSSGSYPPCLPPLVADAGEDFEGEICSGDPIFTCRLSGTGSRDCDGDLCYEWTMLEGPADPNFSNSEDPQTSISLTVEGTYIFQVAVSNACGQEDVDNVTVIVTCTPPTIVAAEAGDDVELKLRVGSPSVSYQLNGAGTTDCDGALSYLWTMVGGPAEISFVNNENPTTDISVFVAGTYILQLTVSNECGQEDSDTVTVVTSETSVVADAGDDVEVEISAGSPSVNYQLNGAGTTDCDGDLDYFWSMVDGPAAISFFNDDNPTTNISVTVAGTYILQLNVWNECDQLDWDIVTVVVTSSLPPPPVASAGEDVIAFTEDTTHPPLAVVQLSGSGAPNGQPDDHLNYEWTVLEGPTDPDFSDSANKETDVTLTAPGNYTLQLRVSDAFGQEDFDTITVVNAGSDDPYVDCENGAVLTGVSSTFKSQNYKNPYESNSYCSWLITVPIGWAVKLSMVDFEVEDGDTSGGCEFDNITVYDGYQLSEPVIGAYCGTPFLVNPNVAPDIPASSSSQMLVLFRSDGSVEDDGFELRWDADGCVQGACENGATCVSNTYPIPPTCVCAPGFTGPKCEISFV